MIAHELSPSELEDVHHLYGTSSFEDALTMERSTWDRALSTVPDICDTFTVDIDAAVSDDPYEKHVLTFDDAQATKIFPDDVFSPIVYELPIIDKAQTTDGIDEYFGFENHIMADELYKYIAKNPYFVSRIVRLNGAPTNVQLFDFASASEYEAARSHSNVKYIFESIANFLGLKAPTTEGASAVDHLNGIDIFLIPSNQETEELGIFTDEDSSRVGGYAFVQANGRYAMAVKNYGANRYVTAHEFGHILNFITSGTDEVTDEISPTILQAAGLSKEDTTLYGATHDSELIAEAFAIASLGQRVREVTQSDGTKNVQIAHHMTAAEHLLAAIFGEPKKDDFTKAILTKYHNLFRLMLKEPMPNVAEAIQKNKRRYTTRKR